MAVLISAPTIPSTIVSGSVPATMRSGRWKVTATNTYASPDAGAPYGFMDLFNFTTWGSGAGDIYLENDAANGVSKLYVPDGAGGYYLTASFSASAAQPVTFEFDWPNGRVGITGATTGNGYHTVGSGTAITIPAGNVRVGQYDSVTLPDLYTGTFGDIEDFAGSAIAIAATDAGWTAAATLVESTSCTIAATDSGWNAAASLTENIDIAAAATDAGWTALAYMGSAMDVVVAATDAGWTAAASMSAAISCTVAATDAGWTAAATLTENIAFTAAATDSGWNASAAFSGASSSILRIDGRNFRDGVGNVWVPRGPELVVDSVDAVATIAAIAATGANSLRVLLTLDAINNQTPAAYQEVIGAAVSHGMVVWISMFSWNDEAVPPRAIAAAFGGGVLQEMSDYLLVWERQWIKDIVTLYDGWVVLDAMQEFTTDITPQESPEAIAAWVDEVKDHIEFFRAEGYTQPLDVMTSFQGRDLASIIDNAAEILAVDTVEIAGSKQTCFGWQAYWGDEWYRGWQGERLLGVGQSITASEAIEQFVATVDYCIMVGIDTTDIPGDESWNDIMPTCHAQTAGWLWWEWSELAPGSGTAHGSIVRTRLPDGFAGAVLAQDDEGIYDISVIATDAGWTAAATLVESIPFIVAATEAGWTAAAAMAPPLAFTVAGVDAGWTALASIISSYSVDTAPKAGAFVTAGLPVQARLVVIRDTVSNPDGGFIVGVTGYNGPDQL